jgi:hypothetical protein
VQVLPPQVQVLQPQVWAPLQQVPVQALQVSPERDGQARVLPEPKRVARRTMAWMAPQPRPEPACARPAFPCSFSAFRFSSAFRRCAP